MAETTSSAPLGNIDWSKFDFTRWNLGGLGLDATSSPLTTMLQTLMAAPQWPQAVGSNFPAIKNLVLQHLNLQIQTLQGDSAALDQELAARTAATQSQIAVLQSKIRQASVPPSIAPNANQFQIVAKAIDQQSQIGLPGLTVQLSDPRNPSVALAKASTDTSGNAILALNKDQAESLANEKTDLTLTILDSTGKTLYTMPNAVISHPNQVETQIAVIPTSADTTASLEVASTQSSGDSALLASLTAKVDQLQTAYAANKQDIQNQITQIQSTVAALQAESKPAATS